MIAAVMMSGIDMTSQHFEASGFHFGRRHLGFLEPEVTIFGRHIIFDSKWDHNLLNEHHAVLKKT